MRIVFGILLALLLITIFIYSYKKNKDFFSPLCFFALLQFIKYVPNIIFSEYEHFVYLNIENTFILFIIEFVFIISVFLGYTMIKRSPQQKNITYEIKKNT